MTSSLENSKEKKTPSTTLMESSTKAKVDLLRLYLENLPNSIPHVDAEGISEYNFSYFLVDDDDVEDKGHVGAISRQLEIRLGHRHKGPILFVEQGPDLRKLSDYFELWLTDLSSDPEVAILYKWLDDLIIAAENAYASTKTPVRNAIYLEQH